MIEQEPDVFQMISFGHGMQEIVFLLHKVSHDDVALCWFVKAVEDWYHHVVEPIAYAIDNGTHEGGHGYAFPEVLLDGVLRTFCEKEMKFHLIACVFAVEVVETGA
jgi:hypothetical protein